MMYKMNPVWWLTLFMLIVLIMLGIYSLYLHDNYDTKKDRVNYITGVLIGISSAYYISVLFLTYKDNGG